MNDSLPAYRSGMARARQKIQNVIDIWKEDLGSDYSDIRSRIVE